MRSTVSHTEGFRISRDAVRILVEDHRPVGYAAISKKHEGGERRDLSPAPNDLLGRPRVVQTAHAASRVREVSIQTTTLQKASACRANWALQETRPLSYQQSGLFVGQEATQHILALREKAQRIREVNTRLRQRQQEEASQQASRQVRLLHTHTHTGGAPRVLRMGASER